MKKKNLLMTAIAIFGLATISMAQVPSYVPTNGLVGWWPFNFNSNDESGNGNNGTVNGALPCLDRFSNPVSAYEFNGSNSSIFISNAFDLPVRTSNIWFLTTISTNINSVLFSTRNPNLQNGRSTITINNNNLCMGYSGGINGCGIISLNIWHMATIVRNTDSTRHYIDGELISTSILGFDPGNSGQLGLSIGVTTSGFGFFNGKIDDIGIWNRALTDCEIKDLFNSQLGSSNSSSSQTQTALDSYTWPVNNQTYTQSGIYTAVIPNEAGCDSTITLDLSLDFTGLENNSQGDLFSLFPNPAQNIINVNADSKLIGHVYSIYDNTGRVVLNGKLNSQNTTIELSNLSGGIYIFSVGENMKQTFKVIKE